MARPRRIAIREELLKLFPAQVLRVLARKHGAVKRRRKVDPVKLFWSLVLGFGGGRERTISQAAASV